MTVTEIETKAVSEQDQASATTEIKLESPETPEAISEAETDPNEQSYWEMTTPQLTACILSEIEEEIPSLDLEIGDYIAFDFCHMEIPNPRYQYLSQQKIVFLERNILRLMPKLVDGMKQQYVHVTVCKKDIDGKRAESGFYIHVRLLARHTIVKPTYILTDILRKAIDLHNTYILYPTVGSAFYHLLKAEVNILTADLDARYALVKLMDPDDLIELIADIGVRTEEYSYARCYRNLNKIYDLNASIDQRKLKEANEIRESMGASVITRNTGKNVAIKGTSEPTIIVSDTIRARYDGIQVYVNINIQKDSPDPTPVTVVKATRQENGSVAFICTHNDDYYLVRGPKDLGSSLSLEADIPLYVDSFYIGKTADMASLKILLRIAL